MKISSLRYSILSLSLTTLLNTVEAQSIISFNPGMFYHGGGFEEEVQGGGAILGLEYTPKEQHFFSIELRSRFGGYSFKSDPKLSSEIWTPPEFRTQPRAIDYSAFNSQIGIIPKLNFYLNDEVWFFLENEFTMGIFTGSFKYLGENYQQKKNITAPILSYNISVGAGYQFETWAIAASIGYSTLNYRGNLRRNQPKDFTEGIPNQNAILLIDLKFRVPLTEKKKK